MILSTFITLSSLTLLLRDEPEQSCLYFEIECVDTDVIPDENGIPPDLPPEYGTDTDECVIGIPEATCRCLGIKDGELRHLKEIEDLHKKAESCDPAFTSGWSACLTQEAFFLAWDLDHWEKPFCQNGSESAARMLACAERFRGQCMGLEQNCHFYDFKYKSLKTLMSSYDCVCESGGSVTVAQCEKCYEQCMAQSEGDPLKQRSCEIVLQDCIAQADSAPEEEIAPEADPK